MSPLARSQSVWFLFCPSCVHIFSNMWYQSSRVSAGRAHVSMSVLSSGHVSVGGGGEGASEALQLRVAASFLPGYVGGGDRRCWVGGHRQDLGHLLPNL